MCIRDRSKNAQEFISILQKKGILVGLVSGGFTPIVERLAKSLGISYFSANQLEVKDGFLTGKLVGEIVTGQVKQVTLEKWRKEFGFSKERTIAIGDGANDLLIDVYKRQVYNRIIENAYKRKGIE